MHWTEEDEQILASLVKEQKTLHEIADALHRSPEAISMKLKRMGLHAPEKASVKNAVNKVTEAVTTTTPKLEIAKFEELPSPNETMGLLWAALRRLQEPDVSREEAKRLRLIIQGVKSYIHLNSDYVIQIRRMESEMLSQWKHFAAHWKLEAERAKTPEEKAKFKERMREAEQHVKELTEAGIKEIAPFKRTY